MTQLLKSLVLKTLIELLLWGHIVLWFHLFRVSRVLPLYDSNNLLFDGFFRGCGFQRSHGSWLNGLSLGWVRDTWLKCRLWWPPEWADAAVAACQFTSEGIIVFCFCLFDDFWFLASGRAWILWRCSIVTADIKRLALRTLSFNAVLLMIDIVFGLLRCQFCILIGPTGAGPFSEVILFSNFTILLFYLPIHTD